MAHVGDHDEDPETFLHRIRDDPRPPTLLGASLHGAPLWLTLHCGLGVANALLRLVRCFS
eukprot:9472721-Pyramimonas_sp.AAC.1